MSDSQSEFVPGSLEAWAGRDLPVSATKNQAQTCGLSAFP